MISGERYGEFNVISLHVNISSEITNLLILLKLIYYFRSLLVELDSVYFVFGYDMF